MGLSLSYILRRLSIYVVVIWVAATINFFVPRLAPGDPAAGVVARLEQQGGRVENRQAIIAEYRRMFGLDDDLWRQYVKYLGNLARLELGYSIAYFPSKVTDIIARGLPWTIGLIGTAWMLSFIIGTTIGALMAWPRNSQLIRGLVPVTMVLAAIPYYLTALLLLWLFAFNLGIFPAFGTEQIGKVTSESGLARIRELLYYSALPALSIMLSSIGAWAIGMRAMMIGTLGQDYLMLAEAKGLPQSRIFLWYGLRNAILPQVTALVLALGHVVSGAVIVELLFSYPGIGLLLYDAINGNDYPLIQGITLLLVVSVATAALVIDLLYPRIDPRISYARR